MTTVALAQYPKDELIERFMATLDDHKKRYGITKSKEDEFIHKSLPIPLKGRLSSELQKYLDMHRLRKQGMKWDDIVKKMSPAYTYLDKNQKEQVDPNGRRLFYLYDEKARKIIENVENGIFPGKY